MVHYESPCAEIQGNQSIIHNTKIYNPDIGCSCAGPAYIFFIPQPSFLFSSSSFHFQTLLFSFPYNRQIRNSFPLPIIFYYRCLGPRYRYTSTQRTKWHIAVHIPHLCKGPRGHNTSYRWGASGTYYPYRSGTSRQYCYIPVGGLGTGRTR